MALADPYATVAEYKAVTKKTSSTDDTEIANDLLACSRYIDNRVGRFFVQDETPQSRIYQGSGRRRLWTDDFVSLTAVAIDENLDGTFSTILASTDYQTLPLNSALGPEYSAYTGIQLVWWGSRFIFPSISQVKITGTWGWAAVPYPISTACVQLAAILRLESPRATGEIQNASQVLKASSDAEDIIEGLVADYRRVTV